MRTTRFLFAVLALALCIAAPVLAEAPPDSAAMAYCTPDHLTDAYDAETLAELTGDRTSQAIDAGKVQAAIDDYGDFVETAVRAQYPSNPFDSGTRILRQIHVEGAYLTLVKRSRGGLTDEQIQAERRLDKMLWRISSGDLALQSPAEEADPTAKLDPASLGVHRQRLFTGHRRTVDLST